MSIRKKYKAVIIGCGRIASSFAKDKNRKFISTHAEAYLANTKVDLVAACDTNLTSLNEFGQRWNVPKLYLDADEMLKKERPDIVSVCTWNSTHAALVKKAAMYGAKSIICEKPISDSLRSAEQMIQYCDKKNSALLINYGRRYMKLFMDIQKRIRQGTVGDIQAISCFYTAGVLNTGTHLFDFLRMFCGEVEWVWSDPNSMTDSKDPDISGYIRFKSGFGCTVQALNVNNFLMFEADIYGSKERIRMTDSGEKAIVWQAQKHPVFAGYKALRQVRVLNGNFADCLSGIVDDAVKSICKHDQIKSSGEDGLRSLEIAQAMIQSAKSGKRITLPLKQKKLLMESK